MEIFAIRHVKQGIEAEGFRAVQALVQPLHLLIIRFVILNVCIVCLQVCFAFVVSVRVMF